MVKSNHWKRKGIEMQKINMFSAFDGHRTAKLIADNLGMNIGWYYSSEIDKHAIEIGRKNHPKCVEIGDITKVNVFDLDFIDLYVGGSPCKNLSMQGNREGIVTEENIEVLTLEHYLELKESDFQFKGESWLFWEYVRCLRDIQKINPDVKFLLENVMMDDKWADIFTKELGVKPVISCASDVSPALRPRMYWANWDIKPLIKESRKSVIKDIMVSENEDYKFTYMDKERFNMLVPSGSKGLWKTKLLYHKASRRQGYQVFSTTHKLECIDTCGGGGRTPFFMLDNGLIRYALPIELERCMGLPDDYTKGVADTYRKKLIGNGWDVRVGNHNFQCLIESGWMK